MRLPRPGSVTTKAWERDYQSLGARLPKPGSETTGGGKTTVSTEASAQMHQERGVTAQRETAIHERGRPHHALRVAAEGGRLRGDAEGTGVQRAVVVQVLVESQGIRPLGQAFAGNGDGLAFHLHAEAREEFLQEIVRRGIDGYIEETLHAVDVAHFKGQALGLRPRRASRQEEGSEENHCFSLHTNRVLITLQTYALILREKNIRDRRQGFVTSGKGVGRTGGNWDGGHLDLQAGMLIFVAYNH